MLTADHRKMNELVAGLSTKSDKIRRLVQQGYRQSDVARFLGIRDQFVSNVVRQSKQRKLHGFEENSTDSEFDARGTSNRLRLRVDGAGRVLLPANVRRIMGIEPDGGEVMVDLCDGELRLITPVMAVKNAQKLVQDLIPGEDSLADQLIEDRKREAASELNDG